MSRVKIIGVPLDLGAGRRGVDMGPSALRIARLNTRLERLGHTVVDQGDIKVAIPETQPHGDERVRYLPQIVDTCRVVADLVEEAQRTGYLPLILGGDHSVAIGTLAGVAAFLRSQEKRVGVLWIDAHSDVNTPETSPSGNIHGMPLAACLGIGAPALTRLKGFAPKIRGTDVALVGVRSIDPAERLTVRDSGILVSTMRDIDEKGIHRVIHQALERVTRNTAALHVSFDLDVLDPTYAPGVGTPVKGGITYREAHLIMEIIADSQRLTSLEMVEINPLVDNANATAELGVGLILSALGKRIL